MNFTFLLSASVLTHSSSGIIAPLQPRSLCRDDPIYVFSGCFRPRDGMILATVLPKLVFACSGIRTVARFRCIILADLAIRGFAISFLTLARVASRSSFFDLLGRIDSSWHRDGIYTAPFCTVPTHFADSRP